MQPYLVPIDLSPLAESFNQLPHDQYIEGRYRRRRMSYVDVNNNNEVWTHVRGSIMQPSDINGHLGDIERTYYPLLSKVFYDRTFRQMCKLFQGITGWTGDFHVHQIRITANADGSPTPVAPEGPHSDGYKFTMPFVVGRTNVHGGIAEIYGDNNILLSGALSNTAVVFDDSVHKHYATPIELIDHSKPGYWDTFVITTGV